MPRDGSNVYHYPTGIEGNPNEIIESAGYNSFLADVEQDANLPRPILAGGTGATSADAALVALGGEKAKQGPVTNFDTFPWVNGSFSSNAGANGAPTPGYAYIGIYYEHIDPQSATIEARSVGEGSSGQLFIRQKTSGVWGPWVNDNAEMETKKVNRTGDTMTGALNINSGGLWINLPAFNAAISFKNTTGNYYKTIRMGATSELEILDHTGTQVIWSLADSGNVNQYGALIANSYIRTNGNTTAGTYFFGSGNNYLNYDGSTYFTLNGGQLIINNNAVQATQLWGAGNGTSNAQLRLQDSNGGTSKYIRNRANSLEVLNNAFSAIIASLSDAGVFECANQLMAPGYRCRTGFSGVYGTEVFNIFHDGGAQQLWINTTSFGTIAFTSDYRTKKDITDLPSTWDTVKELRPIKYSHKDFTPPSEKNSREQFMKGDNIERWGFLAHELQETLIESAATGVKDSPNIVQSPNPWTIIAALTRTLQEAMARIEVLESRET